MLRISPKTVGALDRLAWISSTYPEGWRNGARAVEWAEQACSLTSYASPELLGTLAVAYAEVGRFGDALRMVHKAQLLARQSERTGLEELHAEWLRLFETNRPYREKFGLANRGVQQSPSRLPGPESNRPKPGVPKLE